MFNSLPGFREFYPEDCARRNHLFRVFREVARKFGFQEYDAPVLEPLELYTEKSGEEIVSQLFCFEDKGGRGVSLRPEMTPSLARLVGAKANGLKKPIKWFHVGEHYRYEKPQKGRLRAFYQFNADILGESGPQADSELITLLIELFGAFGLNESHFKVRLSDRQTWVSYLKILGIQDDEISVVLGVIDKSERESKKWILENLEKTLGDRHAKVNDAIEKLKAVHSLSDLEQLCKSLEGETETLKSRLEDWKQLLALLSASGVEDYIKIDFGIVRGLAYYTGFVFEAFEVTGESRALAGGGRYDELVGKLAKGGDMPATGMGIGDVTLSDCLAENNLTPNYIFKSDIFIVTGGEQERLAAVEAAAQLRRLGLAVECSYKTNAFGKQLKEATRIGASLALIFGDQEIAENKVMIRDLATRDEKSVPQKDMLATVSAFFEEGKL